MAARKRKAGRPKGSGDGLSEEKVLIPGPALLWAAAAVEAQREGVSRAEYVRRAVRARLGWREEVPESVR
jgi:hypothetical protein